MGNLGPDAWVKLSAYKRSTRAYLRAHLAPALAYGWTGDAGVHP
ncbi:hypothetical protein [Hymenobacter coccineus]|nr:hypothetical protein [Hymenobacter coccineus]